MTKEYRFKRALSQEHRNKISSSLKGRKLPQSVKDKISKRLKEIWATIPYNEDKQKNTENNKLHKEF